MHRSARHLRSAGSKGQDLADCGKATVLTTDRPELGARRMRMFTKEATLGVVMLSTAVCSSSSATPATTSVDGAAGAAGSETEGGKDPSPANLRQFESGAEA